MFKGKNEARDTPTGVIGLDDLTSDINARTNGKSPLEAHETTVKGKIRFPIEVLPKEAQEFIKGSESALGIPPDFFGAAMLFAAGAADGLDSYFKKRVLSAGINPDAAASHGLYPDGKGNVVQRFRNFDGSDITFNALKNPYYQRDQKRWKDRTSKKSWVSLNVKEPDIPIEELAVVRYSPSNYAKIIEQKPEAGKYRFPSKYYTGRGLAPMPGNKAIEAFKNGLNGGTVYFTEGYFKAVALTANGQETTAFTGISNYKICEALAEYLMRRQPDNVVILYDNDGRDMGKELSSKRPNGFYNSALKFALQFFDLCQRHDLKTKLYFAMGTPAEQKGIDDLLSERPAEREAITENLESLTTGDYIEYYRLFKTKYKKTLANIFKLSNYRQFYEYHKGRIKDEAFKFFGATYRRQMAERHFNLFNAAKNYERFQMLEDPFKVDIDAQIINIKRYLGEAATELDNIIKRCDKFAVNAPTASGKTTFFIDWARRKKEWLVVTVPVIALARQLAEKHKIPPICGRMTGRQIAAALQKKIVVCTYDMLPRVRDIDGRVLIIDESHNLINQHNFREKALRQVLEISEQARKTVLISGTQNELLCKTFGFDLVNIKREFNNIVNVHSLEDDDDTTAVLISELKKIDFEADRIHLVYLNNTNELHRVKDTLIEYGAVTGDQVEVVTRSDVDAGNCRVFDSIVKNETITGGVKLVLCTCLLAEGININNENIGNLYAVNINCLDSFRQFSARFRNMPTVNLYSIRKTERPPQKRFFIPTEIEAELHLNIADTHRKHIESRREYYLNDYDKHDLEFYDDIRPKYNFPTDTLRYVYETAAGKVAINRLQIIADERRRKIETMTNCYFYSQLARFDNFVIQGQDAAKVDEAVRDDLKALRKSDKETKAAAVKSFANELKTRPEVVLAAARLHATRSRNLRMIRLLDITAADIPTADEDAAADFLRDHLGAWERKWFNGVIRAYCKLRHIGASQDAINKVFEDWNKNKFDRFFRALKNAAFFQIYENRRQRKLLSLIHKCDIRAMRKVAAAIRKEAAANGGRITSTRMVEVLSALFGVYRGSYNPAAGSDWKRYAVTALEKESVNAESCRRWLEMLFSFEKTVFSNHREYKLTGEYYPPDSPDNYDFLHAIFVQFFDTEPGTFDFKPLKMIDLC